MQCVGECTSPGRHEVNDRNATKGEQQSRHDTRHGDAVARVDVAHTDGPRRPLLLRGASSLDAVRQQRAQSVLSLLDLEAVPEGPHEVDEAREAVLPRRRPSETSEAADEQRLYDAMEKARSAVLA